MMNDRLILILMVAGAAFLLVLTVLVGRVFMRASNRKIVAWFFSGAAVIGVVIVVMLKQGYVHETEHRLLQQAEVMVHLTENLVDQAVHQQKEREQRTEAYLRERQASVGDVFPLTELTEAEVTRVGLAWLPEVDEQFRADSFPSQHTAMRILIRRITPVFAEILPEGTPPKVIQVTSGSRIRNARDQRMFDDASAQLGKEFPDARVLFDPSDHQAVVPDAPGVEGGVSLQLTLSAVLTEVDEIVMHGGGGGGSFPRTLSASLKGANGTAGDSVLVFDKPWVDQFDQYSSSRLRERLVVVRSNSFAATAEGAHQQAVTQAVELLLPGVYQSLNEMAQFGGSTGVDRGSVEQGLRRRVAEGYLNSDRFTQSLQAPYGMLWREAILLELDKNSIRLLVNEMAGRSEKVYRARLSQGFAVCILLVVIVLLYLFLNWATKGYYKGKVSLIVGLLGAAGSILVLLVLL